MTQEQQRIAIAEASGWTNIRTHRSYIDGIPPNGQAPSPFNAQDYTGLPDYLNDLNAMHEAEKAKVMDESSITYFKWLTRLSCPWCASAAQRAEAFLRTLGLWETPTINKEENATAEGPVGSATLNPPEPI